jgi:hypothetical protein
MAEDNASQPNEAKDANQSKPPKLKPALEQLGTALCPICKRRVAVYLTKTHDLLLTVAIARPGSFTTGGNRCAFCGAR